MHDSRRRGGAHGGIAATIPRRICPADRARAAKIVESWRYWREVQPEEVEFGVWFTDDERTWIAWLVPVPAELLSSAIGLHACVRPGHRVPSDWQDAVALTAATLGAERVLVYVPAECREELHARVLARYLLARKWRPSAIGPVLELGG